MTRVRNSRVIYNAYPDGYPVLGETLLYDCSQTIDLGSAILNGGILVKIIVVSIDPYLRTKMEKRSEDASAVHTLFRLGDTMNNWGIGRVLRSENPPFSPGEHIYGQLPFAEYAILPDSSKVTKITKHVEVPWSAILVRQGCQTAYYGWVTYIRPRVKKGDVLFVTTGAGPVGSVVIQLAKREGMKVIASAGSDDKVQFMEECGADVAFNYKTTDTKEMLDKHGPIDVYWDHVGGETLDLALDAASKSAFFLEVGMISGYNTGYEPIKNIKQIMLKDIAMQGFHNGNFEAALSTEFYQFMPEEIASGRIKYKEYRKYGLETVGQTLLDVLTGKNGGKAVIVVADE